MFNQPYGRPAIAPLTASLPRGGSTIEVTCADPHVEFQIDGANPTGSSVDKKTGLFTSGPNAGMVQINAMRFDGASYPLAIIAVT